MHPLILFLSFVDKAVVNNLKKKWLIGCRYTEKRIVLRTDLWATSYVKLCLSLSYRQLPWVVMVS